jgi:hypothetical protein
MAQSTYSGIDYGMGSTNVDTETGIRYGVINANDLASVFWEIVESDGTDLDFKQAMDDIAQELESAIKSALSDYSVTCDYKEAAQAVMDSMTVEYESPGDCTRYHYEDKEKGLIFQTCSGGDIFVIKSPYYTFCSFCSPCAPGAGSLGTDGNVQTYCLGPEWFDEDHPMPYECHRL